jgi:hypothetical protein
VEPSWLIVANVCRARPYGELHEPRSGLRWLRAGAKVYVLGGFGGMGYETVTVLGRHRHHQRLFVLHVRSRHLVNWRVKLVYQETVLRLVLESGCHPFGEPVDGSPRRREALTETAGMFAGLSVAAHLVGGPCDGESLTLGPGEPPAQLLVPLPARPQDGVRYLRRAWDREAAHYDYAPSRRDAP